jgi:hypothetical protein
MRENNEEEEKSKEIRKEKEEADKLTQKVQAVVQQLYKEVPEVRMVVKATIEEQVGNINKAISGLRKKITTLEGSTTTGTPPEERAQRERISQTTVVKIKTLEHECIKICDEGTCMWTEMTNTLEIQALDKQIRVAHEQTIHATE